jgi:hypothetical protein
MALSPPETFEGGRAGGGEEHEDYCTPVAHRQRMKEPGLGGVTAGTAVLS